MSTQYHVETLDSYGIAQLPPEDLAQILGCLCTLMGVKVSRHTHPTAPANYFFGVEKKDAAT